MLRPDIFIFFNFYKDKLLNSITKKNYILAPFFNPE
jgi:hypothetical protein